MRDEGVSFHPSSLIPHPFFLRGLSMPENPQVLGLLEEMLDLGKTPEEACRDCPDLLPEVQERWQQFRRLDAEIVALFPGIQTAQQATPIPSLTHPDALPRVPGYEVE